MKNKILILVSVILVVVAIGGCLWYWQNKQEEENTLEQTGNKGRFTLGEIREGQRFFSDKDLGFSFNYPIEWGEPNILLSQENFDTGKGVFINFSQKDNIRLSFFDDKFSFGVSEGSPLFFNQNLDVNLDLSEIKSFFKNDHFDVLSAEKVNIKNKIGIKILGNRGYVQNRGAVSWLLPNFIGEQSELNVFATIEMGEYGKYFSIKEIEMLTQAPENLDDIGKILVVLDSIE